MIILLPWLAYLITWLAIGFPITLDYRYIPFGGKTPYYYSPLVNITEIGSWAVFCPLFLFYCLGIKPGKGIAPHAAHGNMPEASSR